MRAEPIASPLFGREAEMQVLTGLIRGVRDEGDALVLTGDAGIGKTALLRAASRLARDSGMLVLEAAGVESEARLPFSGLHQLLQPILAGAPSLPPPQRDALLSAFGMAEVKVTDPFLVALAALDLATEAATNAPVLMVVEDAHWLDRCSADALSFVARRVSAEPVVLVAAMRDDLRDPLEVAGIARLPLGPLDEDAASALIDARAPGIDAAVRERVLREAAGNPLALVELPIAIAELADRASLPPWLPLTTRLEQAFAARLSALPTRTRTLMLVAALNDREALSETLSATAIVVGGAVTLDDLVPAMTSRLADVEDDQLRFRHPLVRSAVHQRASLGQRCAVHAALARILVDDADRSVWHRAAASRGPDEDIASELEAAATRVQHRGGVVAAVAALERAARLSGDPASRGRRLLHAAELGFELGRQDLVDRLVAQAEPLELGPHEQAQRAWLRGVFDEGLRSGANRAGSLVEVARRMIRHGEQEVALRLLWSAALQAWWSDPGRQVREDVVAATGQIEADDGDPRPLAIVAFAAPLDHGAMVLDRLARLASGVDRDPGAARVLGTAATAVGAFDLAAPLLAEAAAGLRAQGRLGLVARTLTLQAWSAAHCADLSVAIPVAEEAERLAGETGQPFITATARVTQGMLAALQGDSATTDALMALVEPVGVPAGAPALLSAVQHARGLAALADARDAEAYAHLRRLHDPGDPSYHYVMRCFSVGDLAEAAVRGDRIDDARPVVEEMEAIARRMPSPVLQVGLLYARALLATGDAAGDAFEDALARISGWPFVRARTQLAYGAWLRRHRRRAFSREHLRAARDALDALGVVPWSERARQELRASGEISRKRDAAARDALTPQELQIAQMAAEGLTNREIGHKLYLSHRTVGSHLYHIFPKLDITSRSALARALAAPTGADGTISRTPSAEPSRR